ncbi:MAG TPA: hypothetical protein VLB51_10645 [Methylomirabilota bacterium]|nr:hypothetical protein [Methylomirabilota bacterium]
MCRSCTAELPAASYPDVVEAFKREMVEAWLEAVACSARSGGG